jgi:excisionase family DNA binding protein
MNATTPNKQPLFYTVSEAASVLRVNAATLYRAIAEDAFPAVKIRTRYIVPATVITQLATDAAETGGVVDVAKMTAEKRVMREIERLNRP